MFGKGQQKIIMRTKSPPRTSHRELKQRHSTDSQRQSTDPYLWIPVFSLTPPMLCGSGSLVPAVCNK